MTEPRIVLEPDLEDKVYKQFRILPLKSKLIIYSKLIYGNSFKAYPNDILGLNKKLITKVYRAFIDSIKESVYVPYKKTGHQQKPKASNKN